MLWPIKIFLKSKFRFADDYSMEKCSTLDLLRKRIRRSEH